MAGRHRRTAEVVPTAENKHRKPKTRRNILVLSSFALGAAATMPLHAAYEKSATMQATGDFIQMAWDHNQGIKTPPEERIEHIDATVFKDNAIVKCVSLSGNRDGNRFLRFVRISPETCNTIEEIAKDPDHSSSEEDYMHRAIALGHVAHEISHKDAHDEGITQCYAVQRTAELAQALGADPKIAASYARDYAALSVEHPSSKAYTIPKTCRQGGPFDLHLANGVYPEF